MGKYKYFKTIIGTIVIENESGERQPWTVETLRFTEASSALPEAVRDMARGALQEFGLYEEKKVDPVIPSDTITTIDGIKVYQDLVSRVFFIIEKGRRLFGSLSDFEKWIKR